MNPDVFAALLDAFGEIGGKEVNVTGGELLRHNMTITALSGAVNRSSTSASWPGLLRSMNSTT